MGWMIKPFICDDCGHEWDELHKKGEEDDVECEECGSENTRIAGVSAPALGTYSMADAAGKSTILKKRSANHTMKKALPEWKEKQRAKVKAGKK